MQRWIAVAVLLMMLMLGGGAFAYWNHKQNAPAPMWVPLSIRSDLGNEERNERVHAVVARVGENDAIRLGEPGLSILRRRCVHSREDNGSANARG